MTNSDEPDLFATDSSAAAPDRGALGIPCTQCDGKAWLTPASEVYGRAMGREYVYWCKPCDTRVGCHKGTTRPLGTPANAELRRERERTHKYLDPIWKGDLEQRRQVDPAYKEAKARTKFYQRLATAMQLNEDDCHIAKFDLAQCKRAIELAQSGAFQRRTHADHSSQR
jgi:hypothetical protein